MKQILQELNTGKTTLVEVPCPEIKSNYVLIQTLYSLVSVGTEKMLVNFSRSGYLAKARQQPEKVKMVLNKIKTDGLAVTFDAVRAKLSSPLPLGYCNVGVILKVGSSVTDFKVGDRVVSNGPHAEIVSVSKNLCALVPENVSSKDAAFTIVSSIGLQAIRLASPTLGETFVVSGVGLIGLLTVQMLRANGCRVIALDYDQKKLELARAYGAESFWLGSDSDPVKFAMSLTDNQGVDGVIITAATKSNEPITTAARMSRKRGRIIMLGVTGMELNRSDFYEKELSFQVSCSYGPGRYDTAYEKLGLDYPIGHVRWTQKRNFSAVLELISSGDLRPDSLVSSVFKFNECDEAYDKIMRDNSMLGVLLEYDNKLSTQLLDQTIKLNVSTHRDSEAPALGVIGAGNYASRVLIPSLKKTGAHLDMLCTSGGVSAVIHGKKNDFNSASTNSDEVINNEKINTVIIATQHNTHASYVLKAIEQSKNIFVEKPLAITHAELNQIDDAYRDSVAKKVLMVGFNRRFSPFGIKIKELLQPVAAPKFITMTINAGYIPQEHWVQDLNVGGGRLIGEACHFIDLARFFVGAKIESFDVLPLIEKKDRISSIDSFVITLGFEDGSVATINYFSNGHLSYPKETIEIFCDGKVLTLNNFIKLVGHGWPNFKKMRLWRQDKGQDACCKQFIESIQKGEPAPIAYNEIYEVADVTLKLNDKLYGKNLTSQIHQ
jgi:predicted dehydrogenase/threonine dehydrogenase-like Zn-dependent dehydrogenase